MKQPTWSFGVLTMMRVVTMFSTTMFRNARGFLRCSQFTRSDYYCNCSSSATSFGSYNHYNARLGSKTNAAFLPSFFSPPKSLTANTRLFSSDVDVAVDRTTDPADYALDPESDRADGILRDLGVTDDQRSQLKRLNDLIVEKNQLVNLVSRAHCTEPIVFGRHVLPSVALAPLFVRNDDDDDASLRIVDVGTGGGFPGLPLAILFPQHEFVLVDSVGKKIRTVREMADELGLTNVETHNGRAEEMSSAKKFDYVIGRSVAALPKFCFWVRNLIRNDDDRSRLLYIVGGDVPENVSNRCEAEVPLDGVIHASDKRALVFTSKSVKEIADESGEKNRVTSNKPNKKNKVTRSKKKAAKGHWEKIDNSKPKERGYENFKRYNA